MLVDEIGVSYIKNILFLENKEIIKINKIQEPKKKKNANKIIIHRTLQSLTMVPLSFNYSKLNTLLVKF